MIDDPYVAIPQLLYRYARALDRLDMALLDEVFAPDATVELGTMFSGGAAAFAGVAHAFMGSMAATRHEVSNILIEVDGDRAGFEAHVTAWHLLRDGSAAQVLVVRARYLGRAARRAAGWRLVHHAEVLDWGALTAADPGWFDGNAELPKGSRDDGDPSYEALARAP